jgi:hypothetical protein
MWWRRDCGAGESSHGTAVVCGERKLSAGPCDMWEIVIKKSFWPVVSALEFLVASCRSAPVSST